MTSTDPIAAILDQLAAHHEQLTRHDHLLREHAAARTTPHGTAPDEHPLSPAPHWCNLPPEARAEPIARLRAWVDQVYRPGYGHLAALLGPCWEAHDLCLYGLDIAATLWAVLYQQPGRTPAVLSAQAEYQARVLPALADQFRVETSWCTHPRDPATPRNYPASQARPRTRP